MNHFNKENITTSQESLQETLDAYREDTARGFLLPLQGGSSVATEEACRGLLGIMGNLLRLHHGGHWGQIPPEDEIANERALREGGAIRSAYVVAEGLMIVCTTNADRSQTILSLPEEN